MTINELVLAVLLTISAQVSPVTGSIDLVNTARVIEGEAGQCGDVGMIAVANVYERNQTMYASETPTLNAYRIALLSELGELPDPTKGAEYVFSLSDLKLRRVKRIIGNNEPDLVLSCNNGKMALTFH